MKNVLWGSTGSYSVPSNVSQAIHMPFIVLGNGPSRMLQAINDEPLEQEKHHQQQHISKTEATALIADVSCDGYDYIACPSCFFACTTTHRGLTYSREFFFFIIFASLPLSLTQFLYQPRTAAMLGRLVHDDNRYTSGDSTLDSLT